MKTRYASNMRCLNATFPFSSHFQGLILIVFLPVLGFLSTPVDAVAFENVNNHDIQAANCNLLNESIGFIEKGESRQLGRITINVQNVFPESRTKAAAVANRLHLRTRARVIRNQLLFREGDTVTYSSILESERILRRRPYLYDAELKVTTKCDGKIDLSVRVRDLWTLLPDVSFAESGGDTSSRLGFRDSNFLGLGKQVVIVRKRDEERAGMSFEYLDPNVNGTRQTLSLGYSDNDDGKSHRFNFQRPFYSLDARWSAGVNNSADELVDTLYFRNQAFQVFGQKTRQSSVFSGFSTGNVGDKTHRITLGFSDTQDEFVQLMSTDLEGPFPEDRHYSYPWLGWRYIENNFIKLRNINFINRVEDINLGWDASVRLGYADQKFGGDNEGLIFDASARKSNALSERQILQLSSSLYGVDTPDGVRNRVASVEARYHNNYANQLQFFARLRLTHGHNLFVDNQLLLGGDTGVRGYPSRYQTGDRAYLISLEQRFYSKRELWRLVQVGGLLFADLGRAWFPDADNGVNGGPLKNVGVGLRLSPTRAGKDVVFHLDVGFPVGSDDESVDTYQVRFETFGRF